MVAKGETETGSPEAKGGVVFRPQGSTPPPPGIILLSAGLAGWAIIHVVAAFVPDLVPSGFIRGLGIYLVDAFPAGLVWLRAALTATAVAYALLAVALVHGSRWGWMAATGLFGIINAYALLGGLGFLLGGQVGGGLLVDLWLTTAASFAVLVCLGRRRTREYFEIRTDRH